MLVQWNRKGRFPRRGLLLWGLSLMFQKQIKVKHLQESHSVLNSTVGRRWLEKE
jgi:hypothetical protein